jgi:hypothetical protein
MKKVTAFIGLCLAFVAAGLVWAAEDEPLVNGTFDENIDGWTISPEPENDSDEAYVVWDEYTQSALLLPYGESTIESPPDTDSIFSQAFLLPSDAVRLAFEVTMKTCGSGFETDILTITINDNSVYQLTSSDVYDAAMNDDTHVIEKISDQDGLFHASYKIPINTKVSNLAGSNINLAFTLHNDNADECVSSVYVDNVEVLPDTPPVVDTGQMLELWPPNHKYHTFSLSDCVSVMDDVDGQMDVDNLGRIISIYSDEPEDISGNGDGKTTDDIVIISDSSFKVLAERQGASNGRVYGINFEIEDSKGNRTETTFYLGVPHDQSGDPPVNDGPEAGYVVTAPPPEP